MLLTDILIEILVALIIASIIGAASAFYILIQCVHKQRDDIVLMKKATVICFRFIIRDTKEFHGEEMTDIEKLYKELISSE